MCRSLSAFMAVATNSGLATPERATNSCRGSVGGVRAGQFAHLRVPVARAQPVERAQKLLELPSALLRPPVNDLLGLGPASVILTLNQRRGIGRLGIHGAP